MSQEMIISMFVELHFYNCSWFLFISSWYRDFNMLILHVFHSHFTLEILFSVRLDIIVHVSWHSLENEIGLIMEGNLLSLPRLQDEVFQISSTLASFVA